MMNHRQITNEKLIHQLYTSFQQLDAEGMSSCYHENAIFSDPVFPELKGKEIGSMWSFLIEALKKNNPNWKLEFSEILDQGDTASCRWEAHYTFSLTSRNVHNRINAHFHFQDGKIIRHTDAFDFYRWSRMAFGITGTLLGWTPWFRKKVQQTSAKRLAAFNAKRQQKNNPDQ
jgi:ketosteroid isomerase-like protein